MRLLASLSFAAGLTAAAMSEAQSGVGTFFAVVGPDAVIARSSGVDRATKVDTGKYTVRFSRPVDQCAVTASPLGGAGGQASVAFSNSVPREINVSLFSKAGAPANRAFNLIVFCAS